MNLFTKQTQKINLQFPKREGGGENQEFVINICTLLCIKWASLMTQTVKNPLAMQNTWVRSLGWEDPLEKEMATHSSIPAQEIPWTDKPGELQSMSHKRVGRDSATKQLPNYCVKYFQVNCLILLLFLPVFFPPSFSLLSLRNFHHVYVEELVDISQVFEPVFIILFLFCFTNWIVSINLCPDS